MIIKPRTKGFICTTAHPAGCRENVQKQVEVALAKKMPGGPKKVLIIGASAGYGLSCRVVSEFMCDAETIGVIFDKAPTHRSCGTAGWYNTAAFEEICKEHGKKAWTVNGDGFSDEIKGQTMELVREKLGKVDCVVYSMAAPRRQDPKTGETYRSKILPIGASFTEKTVDLHTGEVTQVTIEPAAEQDIADTVKVMGGEDWALWMQALKDADLLAEGVITAAFSYIGPELTHAVYLNGTIGRAKEDLYRTADELDEKLKEIGGRAFVSVNKALVTQSSAAIPVVPLYVSLLYKVMKEKGLHEGCIEQAVRFFENLDTDSPLLDPEGRLRLDDLEMLPDVQQAVSELWGRVTTENIGELSDIAGYRREFFELFGFTASVDTEQDTDQQVMIPSLAEA